MILYPNQGAGLCNRLLASAHLLAHAEAIGQTVLNGALRKYASYFEGLPSHGIVVRRPVRARKTIALRVPLSILRSGSFPPGEIPFAEPSVTRAEQAALLLLVGWRFRDNDALRQHGAMIRAFFRPRVGFRQAVDGVLADLRAQCDHVIGVHIRRTDYATYRAGKFFYADSTYRRVMVALSAQLPGRVGFLVSSDSRPDEGAFKGMRVQQAPGHELVDLYSLAGCDYLVGPPSTYSMWASFYGKVPLYHLADADAEVRLSDFLPTTGV